MYTFQLQWYALDKYAWTLLGRTHIKKDDVMTMSNMSTNWASATSTSRPKSCTGSSKNS